MDRPWCCGRMALRAESNLLWWGECSRQWIILPGRHSPSGLGVDYCPWCGKKLKPPATETGEVPRG